MARCFEDKNEYRATPLGEPYSQLEINEKKKLTFPKGLFYCLSSVGSTQNYAGFCVLFFRTLLQEVES